MNNENERTKNRIIYLIKYLNTIKKEKKSDNSNQNFWINMKKNALGLASRAALTMADKFGVT